MQHYFSHSVTNRSVIKLKHSDRVIREKEINREKYNEIPLSEKVNLCASEYKVEKRWKTSWELNGFG
jgi:hypothetical protein